MLLRILDIVVPVFGVVLVGFLYARRRGTDMSAANRVNLDVFTPALIFDVLSAEDFAITAYLDLAAAGVALVLGSGLIGLLAARVTGIAPRTLVPPTMFNNSGNMGLPLAVLAFGDEALAAAVVLFMVENLLHFTLGVRIVDRSAGLAGLARMALVLACVLGLAASLTGLRPPAAIAEGIHLLGQISIPLMLFALGVRLTEARPGHGTIGLFGALLRPAAGLAVALPLLALLPLAERLSDQLVLFAVLPPAVLNYMLAERYGQQPEAVAAIVIWGKLGSLVVIPATLVVLLG